MNRYQRRYGDVGEREEQWLQVRQAIYKRTPLLQVAADAAVGKRHNKGLCGGQGCSELIYTLTAA